MKFLIAIAALTLSCKSRSTASLHSTPATSLSETKRLDWESLQGFLKDHATISDLVANLPKFMKSTSNYVLMRYSASECGAEISPESPRVIAADFDSGFVLAWIEAVNSECGKMMQVMQKNFKFKDDAKTAPYTLAVIRENKEGLFGETVKLEEKKHDCDGCHGQENRVLAPIWSPGESIVTSSLFSENWPGAFGGLNRSIHQGSIDGKEILEASEVKKFADGKASSKRYASLEGDFAKLEEREGELSEKVENLKIFRIPYHAAFVKFDRLLALPDFGGLGGKKVNHFPSIQPLKNARFDPIKKRKVKKLKE